MSAPLLASRSEEPPTECGVVVVGIFLYDSELLGDSVLCWLLDNRRSHLGRGGSSTGETSRWWSMGARRMYRCVPDPSHAPRADNLEGT